VSAGASTLPPAPAYHDELTNQLRIAGFWWRVLAFLLDQIVIEIVLAVALRSFISMSFSEAAIFTAIANFLYYGLMVGLARGQTLGMMLCRLRVVNATDRGPVSFNQAMARAVLFSALLLLATIYHYRAKRTTNMTEKQAEVVVRHGLLVLALAAPFVLDVLWVAWDKRRQALHDKFAKTVVIRSR
jgi:uncharacterized RDD family membrane protein YckC